MTNAASLSRALAAAIDEAAPILTAGDDLVTRRRPAPDKCARRRSGGHLVDSAANNHRRFVVGQELTDLHFDGYAQEHWVACQQYADARWTDLIALWTVYNRHLARIIGVMPDDTLQRSVTRHSFDRIAMRAVPADQPSTLGYLVEDYVHHLRHHIRQIDELMRPP